MSRRESGTWRRIEKERHLQRKRVRELRENWSKHFFSRMFLYVWQLNPVKLRLLSMATYLYLWIMWALCWKEGLWMKVNVYLSPEASSETVSCTSISLCQHYQHYLLFSLFSYSDRNCKKWWLIGLTQKITNTSNIDMNICLFTFSHFDGSGAWPISKM